MSLKSAVIGLLAGASLTQADGAGTLLDPIKPLLTPDGLSAQNPLGHVGANGPWQPGPNIHDIPVDVPEGCRVDQAAYVTRHGSRYPDTGAHNGWLEMAKLFRTKKYTASGPLKFIHDWQSPLTNPDIQIAQLSQTGSKELFDLGYTLRVRYPDLYQEGDDFVVWANNYTRVLHTARLFVQGYIGANASTLGTVVSVTGRTDPSHLGDTLAPSDMCPTFKDDSSKQQSEWQAKWMPAFVERLSKYIEGDLELSDDQWNSFPYICGFESQITGRLSPFCDTFTQEELDQYEYQQDLRYYYGVGPGAEVASKVMVPFLDSLMQRFIKGPGEEGKDFDGGSFKVPKLLMSFLNDGQLNELVAASGIFDEQDPLPTDKIAENRLWRSSRISPMRGTIAFERLTCDGTSHPTPTKKPCRPRPTPGRGSRPDREGSANRGTETSYIRIRLNDAVYPLPSCKDGPGQSCALRDYARYVDGKRRAQGNFAKICNVTDPAAPTKVLGASFFTDLAQDHLQAVPV